VPGSNSIELRASELAMSLDGIDMAKLIGLRRSSLHLHTTPHFQFDVEVSLQ
jgi:hypothetical protein